MIIGLSAKAGCGKSTLANLLLAKLTGYQRIGFADVLKEECSERFGFPLDWAYDQAGKEIVIQSVRLPEPMSVRRVLQWWGTDICRARDPHHWVKAMAKRLHGLTRVILDDIRFPNECQLVWERCGLMVRIEPFPGWEPGESASHASETALDHWEDEWDLRLAPDFGELDEAADAVVAWLYEKREA